MIPVLDINITNKCNYACKYCYTPTFNSDDVNINTFKKFLDLAKALDSKYIELCGGEPLLHPNLKELVKLAKEKGFGLILRTNGIFLSQNIDLISENFSWVGISLDGVAKNNDLMRYSKTNLSSEEKFSIPISAFFELKKKNPKIKLILSTMVSSVNCKGLKEFEKYLLNNLVPFDIWKMYRFIPSDYRAKENKGDYYLSKKKFKEISEKINTNLIKKKLNARVIFSPGKDTGGPCFFVSTKGDVWVGSTNVLNINEKTISQIKNILLKRKELKSIIKNKKETYLD